MSDEQLKSVRLKHDWTLLGASVLKIPPRYCAR